MKAEAPPPSGSILYTAMMRGDLVHAWEVWRSPDRRVNEEPIQGGPSMRISISPAEFRTERDTALPICLRHNQLTHTRVFKRQSILYIVAALLASTRRASPSVMLPRTIHAPENLDWGGLQTPRDGCAKHRIFELRCGCSSARTVPAAWRPHHNPFPTQTYHRMQHKMQS